MEWGGRLVGQGGKQPEEKPAVSKKKREGLTPVVQNTKKNEQHWKKGHLKMRKKRAIRRKSGVQGERPT